MKNSDRLIFVPTYNERDNVASMLEQLQKLNLGADILFLDDNSPDGTGKILDELAAKTPEMSVIHRPGKLRELAAQALAELEAGRFHPVAQRFPLAEAAQGHRAIEGRSTVGKTVLIP